MKRRILITGAAGRIGRLLMRGLADAFDVHGIDLIQPLPGIFKADVTNLDELNNLVGVMGHVDSIVHLAMASEPQPPDVILKTNVVGTRNAYEVARLRGIRRVVFASSARVTEGYEIEARPGWPAFESLTNRTPVRPASLYASTKIAGEAIARQYFEEFGIESVCLRLGMVRAIDDPRADPVLLRRWLSHRDLVHLVERGLLAGVKFGVYYGVSANADRFWSLADTTADLGYQPRDNAAAWPPTAPNGAPGRSSDAGVAMRQRVPLAVVGSVSWLLRTLHIGSLVGEQHWLMRHNGPGSGPKG